jgi:hypothetical protein
MSTANVDNSAQTANDDDDVNAAKSSSRAATPSVEAATATSGSRSRNRTPPVTVLPICCILDPEKGLFRVTRSKGKTLAAGGFGITISEPVETTTTPDTSVDKGDGDDDNGELASHLNSRNTIMEDVTTPAPTPTPATSSTTTSQTPNTSNNYLFIEEVLFLHERGMIECYRYIDDDNKNGDSSLRTSTANGDAGRQRRQQQRLDSYQLYNMLEVSGSDSISLPIYLVYAYLLQQDYRVLRHFDNRRDILDAMEKEKTPTQLHNDNDKDDDNDDQDEAGEDDDDDGDDHDEQKEDKEGEGENKESITNDNDMVEVRRKRKRDHKSGLKALRLQLRREAAQAPPPVLCNTNKNSNDDDGTGGVSIAFDVYRPNSNFSKGAPGLPDFYVAATHYNTSGSNGASLSFQQIQRLLAMSAGQSLKIATVSDAGAVIMFGITDLGVPAIQQSESSDTTTN